MVVLGQGPLSLLAPGCDNMGWSERNRAKDARALGIFGIRSNERTLLNDSHTLFFCLPSHKSIPCILESIYYSKLHLHIICCSNQDT